MNDSWSLLLQVRCVSRTKQTRAETEGSSTKRCQCEQKARVSDCSNMWDPEIIGLRVFEEVSGVYPEKTLIVQRLGKERA